MRLGEREQETADQNTHQQYRGQASEKGANTLRPAFVSSRERAPSVAAPGLVGRGLTQTANLLWDWQIVSQETVYHGLFRGLKLHLLVFLGERVDFQDHASQNFVVLGGCKHLIRGLQVALRESLEII